MKFRDAYKNMTEEIPLNKELLGTIIEKSREEKQKAWNFKITAALVFAALVIVVGAGYMSKIYNGFLTPDGESNSGYIAYDKNEKSSDAGNTWEDNQSTSSKEMAVPETQEKASSPEIFEKNPVSDTTEAQSYNSNEELKLTDSETSESSVYDDGAVEGGEGELTQDYALYDGNEKSTMPTPKMETVKETDDSISSYNSAQLEKEETASAPKSGGGSSASKGTEVSMGEYINYIGFDIFSHISLPENIRLVIPQSATITREGDKVLYDRLTVCGSSLDGEHSISITVSKISPVQNGVSAFIKGVYIGVESDTLTDEEISQIISSIGQ